MIIYAKRIVTRQEDGATIHYAVDLDFTQLDALAIKAAGNKRKRSHVGPIEVRIVSITARLTDY